MRKIALVTSLTLLSLTACSSPNYVTITDGTTQAQVAQMEYEFESDSFSRESQRRRDGRVNAFGRSLTRITNFVDKYFWNYDVNDPYVNHRTRMTTLSHTGRFIVDTVTAVPGVDVIR